MSIMRVSNPGSESESTRLVQSAGHGDNEINGFHAPHMELGQNGEMERKLDLERTPCCQNGPGKSFIFGGYDGILASVAILSGCIGGGLPWEAILIAGISIILANSVSVGISEYLSSKAHKEFLQAEKRRELWEFKHYRDGEILEMTNRFEARGMARRDAEQVVLIMAQYEGFFVNLMVTEELGLQITDDEDSTLFSDAFVMFLSFAVFGLLPAIFFAAARTISPSLTTADLFLVSLILSLGILACLGVIKSSFSSASPWYSAGEAVSVGALCATVAFIAGALVSSFLR